MDNPRLHYTEYENRSTLHDGMPMVPAVIHYTGVVPITLAAVDSSIHIPLSPYACVQWSTLDPYTEEKKIARMK